MKQANGKAPAIMTCRRAASWSGEASFSHLDTGMCTTTAGAGGDVLRQHLSKQIPREKERTEMTTQVSTNKEGNPASVDLSDHQAHTPLWPVQIGTTLSQNGVQWYASTTSCAHVSFYINAFTPQQQQQQQQQ